MCHKAFKKHKLHSITMCVRMQKHCNWKSDIFGAPAHNSIFTFGFNAWNKEMKSDEMLRHSLRCTQLFHTVSSTFLLLAYNVNLPWQKHSCIWCTCTVYLTQVHVTERNKNENYKFWIKIAATCKKEKKKKKKKIGKHREICILTSP